MHVSSNLSTFLNRVEVWLAMGSHSQVETFIQDLQCSSVQPAVATPDERHNSAVVSEQHSKYCDFLCK